MFEREIKFIYDFNLNKVNRLGPYFTFEQLLASDVHPAILHYISAEIDYLIYEDRQKLLRNSLFDYSGEKISFHFNQISEEAKKSKRFAQEYVAKLILHASSFTINYLVRPKWTLTKFVFDEDNHKSTNDIKQILNYVYYYKYVNKILVSYINSKKILSMNAQEFEELLKRADKLGVESYLTAILTNALKSMAEFFNIGEIQKNKIPLSAVELFLEEKELGRHLQKIKEIFGNEEGVKFNLSDYQKVLNNIVFEKEELFVEPEEPHKFETEEVEEEKAIVEEFESGSNETEEEIVDLQEIDEEEHEQDQEQEVKEISENVEKDSFGNELDKDEKIEFDSGKEIRISAPLKYRIKICEDSRIEPVVDALKETNNQTNQTDNEAEESDDTDTIEIKGLFGKPTEEDESSNEPIEEIPFQDELILAEKEFQDNEKNEENDESFLKSIHDQKNVPLTSIEDEEESEQLSTSAVIREGESSLGTSELSEPTIQDEDLKREDENERVIFAKQKKEHETSDSTKKAELEEQTKMELAEILENKEMTKIIEVIFDYDIEDFAATLDEISNCKNEDDAHLVINNTLISRHINRSSKEAQSFRSIISEYFNNQ